MVPEPSANTDTDTSPSLFTPPSGTRSYADATASEAASGDDHPDSLWADIHRQEGEAMDHATTRNRKRDSPLLQAATMSKLARTKSRLATPLRPRRPQLHQLTPADSASTQRKPAWATSPSPHRKGLKHFLAALASGPATGKSLLMSNVPADVYYRCRGYYLQYKHGNYANEKRIRTSEKDRAAWAALQGTIPQDAFGKLLEHLQTLQKSYGIFTAD